MSAPPPFLSIIIVDYHGGALLQNTLSDLRAGLERAPRTADVWVVDNGQDEQTRQLVSSFPSDSFHYLRAEGNVGFGRGNNLGALASRGRWLWLLNNDVRLEPDLPGRLQHKLEHCQEQTVLGLGLRHADGSFQTSFGPEAGFFSECYLKAVQRLWHKLLFRFAPQHLSGPTAWVSGASLVISRALFEGLKGFDPAYFMYYEDMDLCLRARQKGASIEVDQALALTHLLGGGQGSFPSPTLLEAKRSQLYFYQKFRTPLQQRLLSGYQQTRAFLGLALARRRHCQKAQAWYEALLALHQKGRR